MFQASFPAWKGTSVSGLITDTIIPFCDPTTNASVRKAALESLGYVCQTHASHFLKPQILKAFDQVFAIGDKDLMNLVLLGIKGFLQSEEIRSELSNEEAEGKGKNSKTGEAENNGRRLDQLANQNQNDGVSTSLAQKYLKNIIQISMASQDAYALTAVEVIGSILRQGLVHPKEVCINVSPDSPGADCLILVCTCFGRAGELNQHDNTSNIVPRTPHATFQTRDHRRAGIHGWCSILFPLPT